MIVWTALTALAADPPLEVPPDAGGGSWEDAAVLAGFRLGRCTQGPCARIRDGGVEVVLADGTVDRVAAGEPDVALALARSRLVLGARSIAPQAPTSRPRPRPSDAPELQLVQGPTPRVSPRSTAAVSPHTDFALTLPRPPGHLVPPTRWWASAWAGASTGALLGAQVGVQRGLWWTGVGGRVDGSVTVDLGAGAGVRAGPLDLRAGAWFGAEVWPAECLGCSVDVTVGPQEEQVTVTNSLFWAPPDTQGMGPVARLELQLGLALGRRWLLAPRGGVAVSAVGTRPEIAMVVIRTGR